MNNTKTVTPQRKNKDTTENVFFPNGFDSWHETHYEIVISMSPDRKGSTACQRHETEGTSGLYDLAREMTDKFEQKYTGHIWDGDYFDAVQAFCQAENL